MAWPLPPPTRCPGFPNCGKIGFRGPPIPGGRTFSFTVPAKNPAAADCRRFRFPTGGTGRRAGRAGCARRRRCGTGQRLDREAGGDPADGCPSRRGKFSLLDAEGSCPQGRDGRFRLRVGAALRCPLFSCRHRSGLFEGLPVRLASGRISGRRRLWRAPPPSARRLDESPQGRCGTASESSDPHQDESGRAGSGKGLNPGGVPGRRRWTNGHHQAAGGEEGDDAGGAVDQATAYSCIPTKEDSGQEPHHSPVRAAPRFSARVPRIRRSRSSARNQTRPRRYP